MTAKKYEDNFQEAWDEDRICTYCSMAFANVDERDHHLMDPKVECSFELYPQLYPLAPEPNVYPESSILGP